MIDEWCVCGIPILAVRILNKCINDSKKKKKVYYNLKYGVINSRPLGEWEVEGIHPQEINHSLN